MNSSHTVFPHSIGTFIGGGGRFLLVFAFALTAVFGVAPARAQTPATPANFDVDASNGVASWNHVANATDYELTLEVGLAISSTELHPGSHVDSVDFTVAPNATNCCVNGESYRARIKATVGGSDSAWSDWDEFTYTGASSITTALTDLTLTLALAYNYTSGQLEITTSSNKSATVQCTTNDGTPFTCNLGTTNVTHAASAAYSVVATATIGDQTATAEAAIYVPASPGPAVNVVAPTGFSVAAGTGVASWTAATNATGYRLELQVGETGTVTSLVPGDVASVNFTTAPNATNCCENGVAYRSRIQTIYESANSPWTTWSGFTYTGTTSLPDTPDLSVAASTGVATWSAVTNVTDYFLQLETSSATINLKPGSHVTTVNFTTANNSKNDCCTKSASYRARIKAATSGGHSDWSGWTQFTYTGDDTIGFTLSTPANFAVDAATGLASWTASAAATGYQLAIWITGEAAVNLRPGNVTSVDLNTATSCCIKGQSYNVNIRSETSLVQSPWSATVNFTYSDASTIIPPGQPVTLNRNVGSPLPDAPSDGGSSAKADAGATPTIPVIPTQDHSQLPAGAEVESASPWIAFREVTGAAISNQAVSQAAMSAIDIMGPLGVDADVCFAQSGAILLLDTAYSPRRQVWMGSYRRADGKTCARVDRAGTVVLMPAYMAPATSIPPPAAAAPATPNPYMIADSLDTRQSLANCRVSASSILHFRERPAGRSLGVYYGESQAIGRTANWFQVIYSDNIGWVSAHHVTTEGDCG